MWIFVVLVCMLVYGITHHAPIEQSKRWLAIGVLADLLGTMAFTLLVGTVTPIQVVWQLLIALCLAAALMRLMVKTESWQLVLAHAVFLAVLSVLVLGEKHTAVGIITLGATALKLAEYVHHHYVPAY